MSNGISNFQIEEAFKNIGDKDIENNFVGVFPSNHMNKFIYDKLMICEEKGKYLFIIAKTDASSKSGTHWWNILDIEPKTDIFLLDSFGLDGLKNFIIQDDRKVIEKILFGTKQMTRTDNKITRVNIKFNFNACKKLTKKELDALSDRVANFFHFVQAFGNKLKLCDFVNIWMEEDRVQDIDSVTSGIFQIYFYDNLFNPNENSKIQDKKQLNKRTVENLLNKLFVLDDQDKNEETNK